MGWLSRTFRPAAPSAQSPDPAEPGGVPADPPVPAVPGSEDAAVPGRENAAGSGTGHLPPAASDPVVRPGVPEEAVPRVEAMPTSAPSSPTGRYGPLVSVTRFDVAPPELEWQLPLNGELYRLMPGSDRPDYSLLVLERPLHFYPAEGFDLGRVDAAQRVEDRKGRTMVRVHAMLLCARFVGQQLHPGMKDLAVNLAYVIDNSLARDPEVDFGKIQFAAIGFLSEGHAPRPTSEPVGEPVNESAAETAGEPDARLHEPAHEPVSDALAQPIGERPAGEAAAEAGPYDEEAQRHTSSGVDDVLGEVARSLREGVEAQRGARVEHLTAVLTIDADHRLTGLSGNADGQAPVPTSETFDRLADLLAGLATRGEAGRVAALTVRAAGDTVSYEVTATHR